MRVRYVRVPGRVAMVSVSLIDRHNWLVGFLDNRDGKWFARHRGDSADMYSHPWSTRTEAAEWLLLSGGWAQRPTVFEYAVAA